MSKYISASLKCESCSELNRDSLELLFVRPSFEKMVISLCDEKNRVTNLYYEDYSRLEEALPYLVINCTNQEVQYKITDVLLKDGSAVGLIALWDSCNIRKLSYYDVYRDSLVSTRAEYALGDLAIIAHNLGDKEECLRLLRIIKKINKSFWGFLRKEIRGNNKIAYYEYDSAFNEYLTTIKSYNRLTGAAYSEPLGGTSQNVSNRYGEMISYDRNSNIASLQRNGMLNDQSFGLITMIYLLYSL